MLCRQVRANRVVHIHHGHQSRCLRLNITLLPQHDRTLFCATLCGAFQALHLAARCTDPSIRRRARVSFPDQAKSFLIYEFSGCVV
jgi:hypothetical protein